MALVGADAGVAQQNAFEVEVVIVNYIRVVVFLYDVF